MIKTKENIYVQRLKLNEIIECNQYELKHNTVLYRGNAEINRCAFSVDLRQT